MDYYIYLFVMAKSTTYLSSSSLTGSTTILTPYDYFSYNFFWAYVPILLLDVFTQDEFEHVFLLFSQPIR